MQFSKIFLWFVIVIINHAGPRIILHFICRVGPLRLHTYRAIRFRGATTISPSGTFFNGLCPARGGHVKDEMYICYRNLRPYSTIVLARSTRFFPNFLILELFFWHYKNSKVFSFLYFLHYRISHYLLLIFKQETLVWIPENYKTRLKLFLLNIKFNHFWV